jgi:serine protease inhibitor
MNMKKAFLIIVCIAFIQQATAQTNPKPGFIITNANDTVYGINDKYATVRLPYGNGKTWNMYVLLPNEGKKVKDVLASLTPTSWKDNVAQMTITANELPLF